MGSVWAEGTVKLTVNKINSLKNKGVKGLYSDLSSRGLYLKTTESKTASWIFRWRDRSTGKLRDMGLGTTNEVSLAEARQQAIDFHRTVRSGLDPIAERTRSRQERIWAASNKQTFDDCARAYIAAKEDEWSNSKHRRQWESTLNRYASPVIGPLPVDQVSLPHVIEILETIWKTKTETATRVRGRIESILDWATVRGYRTGPNPAQWKGNLDHVLPNPSKVKKVVHYPALHWSEIGKFMSTLRAREGIGARALEFTILTAARSSEVRFAEWEEIDDEGRIWTVPEERMKARKPHVVPLSTQARDLIERLRGKSESSYIFEGPRGGPLSDMALSTITKKMEVDAVPHGFRSTFKDWARSSTNFADEVSELALAHVNNDATRAAYARDQLLPQRAKLMQAWSDFTHLQDQPHTTIKLLASNGWSSTTQ